MLHENTNTSNYSSGDFLINKSNQNQKSTVHIEHFVFEVT
jgi:hypothetical protein